jgi:hypothetical protein
MTTNSAVTRNTGNLSPNRLLLIILSTVMIFTVVVVLITSEKEPKNWKISTPQGVVQAYLNAMTSGDTDAAASFLSKKSECALTDLDRVYVTPDMRIYLATTRVQGSSATVTVKVEVPSGGPFADFYSELHTLRLSQVGEKWLLVGIPWPLYDCGVNKK